MQTRHFHRRNLPHLYYNEGIYFVTSCLYGSIHSNKLDQLQQQINRENLGLNYKETLKKYDSLLDKQSNNVYYLRNPEIMGICKSSLHFYEEKDYKIICYCIMPNHMHFVFELLTKERNVGKIMGSIKKFSGRRANKVLRRNGAFWQAENFDRLVRNDIELYFIIKYVLFNPVNAGLVENWKDWGGTYCHQDYIVVD